VILISIKKKKNPLLLPFAWRMASSCHNRGIEEISSFMNMSATLLCEGECIDVPWTFATVTVV